MPFGPYKDFADCKRKNQGKVSDVDAFCGWLKHKIEGQNPIFMQFIGQPELLLGFYRLEFLTTNLLGLKLIDKEKAEAALSGKDVWKKDPDAVVLDDHRWMHMWEKTLSRGNELFISKQQLKKLHDMLVDEMSERRLDSGLNHKTPINVSVLELGGNLEKFLKERKSFLVDPAFINLIGSSVLGKEDADLDLMFHSTRNEDYRGKFLETVSEELKKAVDFVWDAGDPNGPFISAYELWAVPVKNPIPSEPQYRISPMAPIKPAQPTHAIDDPRDLLEDGYYVTKMGGLRAMVHRKESQIIAFGEDLEEIDLPDSLIEAALALEEPKTFIMDGYLAKKEGGYVYYMLDLIWWRESEHISQTAQERHHFMNKIQLSESIQLAPSLYFNNRRDAIDFLKGEEGPILLVPNSSGYPVTGNADWYLYNRDKELKLAEGADARIEDLVDSGKWEGMPAGERFNLMTKRKQIQPLYPFAQMKTTKKGYSEREVFGLKSVGELAKDVFRTQSKQAVEVKVDGFRVQLHKLKDEARIFTESGHDITKQLPNIVQDIKRSAAKSYAVDAEATPYDKEFTNLGRAGAVPAFAKGAKAPVDDSLWGIHVFDVLYIDGEQLHGKPYDERRTRLHGLEFPVRDIPKAAADFKFHIWENKVEWATSAEQMVKLAGEVAKVPGSEGAMFKEGSSKYRLSGNTPLWAKMKAAFEIDAMVVGIIEDGNTFNYVGAVGPVEGDGEAPPAPLDSPRGKNFVKWKGKTYAVLGKTFNTTEKAKIGDIIRVSVKDIRKIGEDAYHWFHPQVLEVREDKARPDPAQVAETIAETVQQKQKATAYLVSARYDVHSPLACCEAAWLAIPGDEYTYLQNSEDVLERLKSLGIERIVGTKTRRELLEEMLESGIDFTVNTALTLGDALSRPIYLQESSLPNEVSFNVLELQAFLQSNRSQIAELCMKLSCGACVPLEKPLMLQDHYMTYPEDEKAMRWVLQLHVRGLSVHGDLRMTISKSQAIGWTLDAGKSLVRVLLKRVKPELRAQVGITEQDMKLPLKDLSKKLNSTSEGKKLRKALTKRVQDLPFSQIKTLCQELWKDEIEPILNDPNKKILTQGKSAMSPVWLDYEQEIPAGAVGATKELEGQLVILDKGTVEFGAQKSYFHEYFLKGDKIGKRRMVVRKIPTQKSWEVKEAFAWLTFFTKPEDLPYAISSRAVKQDWMPPEGISALPKEVRVQIPASWRYWEAKNAKEVRNALVKDELKRKPLKLSASMRFALKRVSHRGPEVRRGLPVTRYLFLLHDGQKIHDAFDFGRDANPLEQEGLVARRRTEVDLKDLIPTTGELSPGHSASMVKKIKTVFDTSDEGKVRLLEDSNNRLAVQLDGKTLKGRYIFVKSGDSWVFQKIDLPEKKAMRLSAGGRRIIMCGTDDDVKIEQRGDLLILTGPAIKPGEVIPMDGKPSFFTKEGIKAFWTSMFRQPVVVMHGPLKGDVVGFVNKRWYDDKTGWGWVEAVIWHPLAMQLILDKKLSAFSIEVLPETVWDPEHQHDHIIGGICEGLSVVPKGACPTCTPVEARMGTISDLEGKVYKFGMTIEQFLEDRYYKRSMSTQEISDETGIPRSTIENWMTRFELPRRDYLESRRLRASKELGMGGEIIVLGSGAGLHAPDDCAQCQEAEAGGKSRRNFTSTLFGIGGEHLLIGAPKGVLEMVGARGAKPKYVLLEHASKDTVGGLHELRGLKPVVFGTKEAWAFIRRHYRELSQQEGRFEEIYNFKRYVIAPGQSFEMGAFTVMPVSVAAHRKTVLGFKMELGGKTVWHGSAVYSIPNHEEVLKGVDVYIGDGSALHTPLVTGHASMAQQIKWAQQTDIPKIFFTQIGHLGKNHEGLDDELRKIAPNAVACFDGDEISLGGSNPMAVFPKHLVGGLLSGDVDVVVRMKPYSEYAKQAILLGNEAQVYALYVEGFPEKVAAKDAKDLKHGLSDKEWKALVGDQETVWLYHPRILKRFEPAREMREGKVAGPYIHDAEMISDSPG
uniref:Putative DNA ligase domain protein n=1 Tax=viral metagenome TaxID=1070528 RepID=A0A6M3M395_9ZZZZ